MALENKKIRIINKINSQTIKDKQDKNKSTKLIK